MESQENILADIVSTEVEVSSLQRILSNIIDLILEIGLLVVFYEIIPTEMRAFIIKNRPISTYLFVFAWLTAYRLLTILLLQRTIGMIICRIKYLSRNFQPLTSREKVIATFLVRTKNIRLYES